MIGFTLPVPEWWPGHSEMADVFMSFASVDADRVGVLVAALRGQGIDVFWSCDIPVGSDDYQQILRREIGAAPVVLVAWTRAASESHPVSQECDQAARGSKLVQALLDDIEPIDLSMAAPYRAEKANLIGWAGDRTHPEWLGLLDAIVARLTGTAARAGEDDLCRIAGIDETLRDWLKREGLFSYAQIARLDFAEIDALNDRLGRPAYIERHNWREQARVLATGLETTFARELTATREQHVSDGAARAAVSH